MKKKILFIEDKEEDFNRVRNWLNNNGYSVIPGNFQEMLMKIEPDKGVEFIDDYAIRLIKKHYRDLVMILCDIRLGEDSMGGNRVVKRIRKFKELSPPNWTSMIPIVGISQHAELHVGIIAAGADCVFDKSMITTNSPMMRTFIDVQVEKFEDRLNYIYPKEIEDKILQFKRRHARETTAFIMTSFARQHKNIAQKIQDILAEHNIKGCLADDVEGGEHTDALWSNIEVYMHGCDFGIGIYADDSILLGLNRAKNSDAKDSAKRDKKDRKGLKKIKRIRINPNLSQEVGYMLALQKKVCILKHEKLESLPADLANKIYVGFNNRNLERKLTNWLSGQNLITKKK